MKGLRAWKPSLFTTSLSIQPMRLLSCLTLCMIRIRNNLLGMMSSSLASEGFLIQAEGDVAAYYLLYRSSNADYQLGTGKRSNLAIPQHIPPLPYPLTAAMKEKLNAKATGGGAKAEESLGSGTVSHMPHNRLQSVERDPAERSFVR